VQNIVPEPRLRGVPCWIACYPRGVGMRLLFRPQSSQNCVEFWRWLQGSRGLHGGVGCASHGVLQCTFACRALIPKRRPALLASRDRIQ
jgi:hypothetical protein